MLILKYKTTVNNAKDATQIINFLELFFADATLKFDLKHSDKILTIESPFDEDHSDIVIELINQRGFECKMIITIKSTI